MKRVKIFAYQVGFVMKGGTVVSVLTTGTHWRWLSDEVKIYDMTKPFFAPCDLNILMENPACAALINIVEIKDNEIGLQYKDGNFQTDLKAGRYAFWKSVVKYEVHKYDINELEVPAEIDRNILKNLTMLGYIRLHVIQEFEQGVMLVEGKFHKKLTPGTYYQWQNQKAVMVMKVDLRQQQMELSGQEMLTKDKAAVRINFDVLFKVVDVEKALIETQNYAKQLQTTLQLALREYIGTLSLDELLARKDDVQTFVLGKVKKAAVVLGVNILSCGIRDIILPGEMKEIMNQVLIAEKKAQASTITRREETASTRSLLNTAKLMEDNEMLFKLKEMEYVEKIADKVTNISVSGGGQVLDQLRDIFGTK